ncbi:MAG: DUF4364 family protein [Lachnospiraceae bacterium]|jgi:hypothetical protein|nr:DUF4364 family protein [Lachnospiraceae bacterium]MCI8779082.1 DUF4364 family protein [Lachnospiraceae bacterium]
MTTNSMKLYKLIILYFLHKAKQEITNATLSDFILKYGYTNYFSIQETLADLTEDNMIHTSQTHAASYYTIADKGLETLQFFSYQLPKDTMQQIDEYLADNKIQITNTASIRTDYTKTTSNEYLVRCTILEHGDTMAEIAITLPTEDLAIDACSHFKKKNSDIYRYLFKALTTDETDKFN